MIMIIFLCAQKTNAQHLSDTFIKDDDNIYIEKIDPEDSTEDCFTRDNVIYVVNREFIYDYYILKGGQKLKIAAPAYIKPTDDFDRSWNFIDALAIHEDKIDKVSFK